MKIHNKPSNTKRNIDLFKSFWENKNIELMPEKSKYGWRMGFRFINEDAHFKSSTYINCPDTAAWYNCAMYVASFLKDENAINSNVYNAYCEQLNRLFNNQCYS